MSETVSSTGTTTLIAELPALESLGFDNELRSATNGAGFCALEFLHWRLIDSDPLKEGTFANKLLAAKRKEKGLPPIDVAQLTAQFIDRL